MRSRLPYWLVPVAVLLSACSMITDVLDKVSPHAEERPPPPDPEPDYRPIIAASFREVFPETSSVRDVSISREVRRTQWVDGPCWRVCMKADAKNMNGDYIGLRTYVVAIRRNKVFDRRRAEPEDGCESEKYEPFVF